MPNSPKKVNRPWVPERKPFERERTPDAFDYNCRRWRNLRALMLQKFPLCVECLKKGLTVAASVVDHIKQVSKGGDGWSEDNLQCLCKKCHDSKSGRERHTGGMG